MPTRIHAARALLLFSLFLALYAASSGTRLKNLEGRGHYFTLATWFLEGRVRSATDPGGEDVVRHEGRYFIAFPPLPALLMTPLVALGGRAANPVLFTAAFGAANVVLVGALLRRGLPRLGLPAEPGLVRWMTVAFALGTAHWYSAAAGTVWHTSQVCGLTFLLLAVTEAMCSGRQWLCGLLLGLATAARPPLAMSLPFFVMPLRGVDRGRAVRMTAPLLAPFLLCVGLLLVYNRARFGAFSDFGYTRMNVGPVLQPFLEQGMFSLRHLPRNLFYGLLNVPTPAAAFPFLKLDPMGNSLFFTSPFLVGALLRRPAGAWAWGTALASVAVLGADLIYFSTGYAQFGYRYSLDAMPFLVLLAAAGFGRATPLLKALTLAAVFVNLLGTLWILNWTRMWAQLTGG